MNDMRRSILWVVFAFSLIMLWDKWQVHNGKPATFFPDPQAQQAAQNATHAAAPQAAANEAAGTDAGVPSSSAAVPQAAIPAAPAPRAAAPLPAFDGNAAIKVDDTDWTEF